MNKKVFIVVSVILASIWMSIVDSIIQPPYVYKSLLKIVTFLGVLVFYCILHKEGWHKVKQLFVFEKKQLFLASLLGILVFLIVMLGYILFKNYIDFSKIVSNLTQGIGVNASNFVFVAVYISFVNSLLEELFYRGFAFMVLKEETNVKFACAFSAFCFAFYHIGMTIGWFHPLVYVLALFGLFVGGCIFNILNEKFGNIYPSYLVHMCANFAINAVGFMLFQIF